MQPFPQPSYLVSSDRLSLDLCASPSVAREANICNDCAYKLIMSSSGTWPRGTLLSNPQDDGRVDATSEFPSLDGPAASGDVAKVEERILALIDGSEEAQVALCDLPSLFRKIYSVPLLSKFLGHAALDGLLRKFSSMIVRSGEGGRVYVCRSCRDVDISDMASVAMSAAINLRQTKQHQCILNILRQNPNGISCNQLTKEVRKLGDIIASSAKQHGKKFISPALVLQHCEGVKFERIGGRRLLFLDCSCDTTNPSVIKKALFTTTSTAALEFLSLLQNQFRDRPWPATGKEMNRFFHSEIDLSMSPKLMAWVRSTAESEPEGTQRKEALKQLMAQLKRFRCMGGTKMALSWDLEVVGNTLAQHYHDSLGDDRLPSVTADTSAPAESSSAEPAPNISAAISASEEDSEASAVGSGSCTADSRATLENFHDTMKIGTKKSDLELRSREESRVVVSPRPKTQSEDRANVGDEGGNRCDHVGRGGRRSHEDAEIQLGKPSSRARVAIIGGEAIVKYAMIDSRHKGMCRLAIDNKDLYYLRCTRGCPRRFDLSHQMEEYLWCRRRARKTLGLLSASVPLDAQSFIIFDHTAKTCGIQSNTNVTHLTLMEGYSLPQKTRKIDDTWLQYTTKALTALRAAMRLSPQIRIECLRKVPKLSDKNSVLVVANVSMSFDDEALAKQLLAKCKLPQFPPHLAVGACLAYVADDVLDLASQRLVGLELAVDVDFLAVLAPSATEKFAQDYSNGGAKKTKKMEKSEAVLREAVASAVHAANEINRALYESLVDNSKLGEDITQT